MSFLLFLCACTSDPKDTDTAIVEPAVEPVETAEPDPEPEDNFLPEEPSTEVVDTCDIPLSTSEYIYHIPTRQNLELSIAGGSGNYSFSLLENTSGAIIHDEAGLYISGETVNVKDVIVVDDLDCATSLNIEVYVYAPFSGSPTTATIPPNTTLTIQTNGGSGATSCFLNEDNSGATITGCNYTAGNLIGTDFITVSDDNTGEWFQVDISVDPEAALKLPVLHWALPVGVPFTFEPSGGTETYHIVSNDGNTTINGMSVTLDVNSISSITIEDDYADLHLDVQIDPLFKVSPTNLTLSPSGSDPEEGTIVKIADQNADGLPDLLVSDPDANAGALASGAAYIYYSDTSGIMQQGPTLTIEEQAASYGVSSAIGDFNADAEFDLAIGAPTGDGEEASSGKVQIHYGAALEFEEVADSILGYRNGDKYGYSLAACDFNGDGYDDLAVGAPGAETATNIDADIFNQGSVLIYLGSSTGLPSANSQTLWGEIPSNNAYVAEEDTQFGIRMTAGDFDGDGNCDLIVAAKHDPLVSFPDANGLVYLYYGVDGISGHGVESTPSAVWTHIMPLDQYDRVGDLGHSLAVGDINGDGSLDLVAGGYDLDEDNSYTSQGLVMIADMSTLNPNPNEIEQFPDAWRIYGDGNYDRFARSIDVGDIDGDALDDLIIGETKGMYSNSNKGAVQYFSGAEIEANWNIGYDATADNPTSIVGNPSGNQNDGFGMAVQIVGDINGDGLVDLGVLSTQDDSFGANLGALYVHPSDDSTPGQAYELTSAIAGQNIGQNRSIAYLDSDGDNEVELWIGGPGEGLDLGANYGAVWQYNFDGYGIPSTAFLQELSNHPGHREGDAFGSILLNSGDVDGDGYEDLAIVASEANVRNAAGSPASYVDNGDTNGNACLPTANQTRLGYINIYRGSATGLESQPSWLLLGGQGYSPIRSVISGQDQDGNGVAEFAFGEPRWDNSGNVTRLIELPAASTGTQVLCGSITNTNGSAYGRFATAIADLGDLDGDGCDEIAASDYADKVASVDGQGSIRVLWGWDPNAQASSTAWSDIFTIFNNNGCNSCHSYSTYSDVVYVASQQATNMNLIEPGDDEASYLWHKINGTHLSYGSGVRMPQNGAQLSTSDLNTIQAWILDGAPESSTTSGCPSQQEVLRLSQNGADNFIGKNMLGGRDVDGDGINDLILGEPDFLLGSTEYGGLTIISGGDLTGLSREVISGIFHQQDSWHDYEGFSNTIIHNPSLPDTHFGASLAFIDDPSGLKIAVGAPKAFDGVGAVYIMELVNGAWENDMILVGESDSLNSNFGSGLASGFVNINGVPEVSLTIGAQFAEGIGVDNGAVFTWTQNGGE